MSKWGDLAVWRPTSHHGGAMAEHRGLVVHIAEGYYEGTIAWQQGNNDVSSHFVVGRGSGQLAQLVDTDAAAWTQRAGNGHWLSAEFEGFTTGSKYHAGHPGWEVLSDWQLDAAAKLLVRAHHQYGVPIEIATSAGGRGLGHHSMGGPSWGHLDCPGNPIIARKPLIIARANKLLGITPAPAGKDSIMTKLPTLKAGATGAAVKRVQVLANLALGGGDVQADGDYGPKTTAQIKRVQAAGHLKQDGVCGPDTWAVLLGVKP